MEILIDSSLLKSRYTPKSGLILCFILFLTPFLQAKETVFKGHAPTMIKAPWSVLKVDDCISGHRSLLAEGTTDVFGAFEITLDLEEVTSLVLHIEGTVASMVAEPGAVYNFTFPGISRKDPQTFAQMQVELEWAREDKRNINVWISSYNSKYDFFFQKHLPEIIEEQYSGSSSYVRSNREALAKAKLIPAVSEDSVARSSDQAFLTRIDGFAEMQSSLLKVELSNTYFSDYVNYSLATTRLMAGDLRSKLFDEYFKDKPARPSNPEYCTAVQQMFPGYLIENVFSDEIEGLKKVYIVERNPAKLDSMLQTLPMMEDPDLRRAMLLINLKQAFYNSRMDRNIPLRHLQRMADLPDHFGWAAEVAGRIVEDMTFGKRGAPLAPFSMVNDESEAVTLEDLEGKFIYIQFVTTWCRSCPDHMELMARLYKTYGRDIEIVTIGMDHTMEDFVAHRFEYPDYEWTWLYGPSDARVLDTFKLKTIPQYFLIDPEGKIAIDHVGAPDEGALGVIEKQIISWRNKHQ